MSLPQSLPSRAASFADLVSAARNLVSGGQRAILGITGAPGAGKSTLAENLLAALAPSPAPSLAPAPPPSLTPSLPPPPPPAPGPEPGAWVAHVPMDGFHLADVELDRLGLRDRKGAPDTFDVYGYISLLERLRADDEPVVYAPSFARDLEQPIAGAIPVRASARLVITEGNYLLLEGRGWAGVRPLLDAIWYCAPDDDVRLERLVRRHVIFGKPPEAAQAWAHGTDERNARLVAATQARADLIVGSRILDTLSPAPPLGHG